MKFRSQTLLHSATLLTSLSLLIVSSVAAAQIRFSRHDIATGLTITGVVAGDFNGDGNLDLVVTNHSASENFGIYLLLGGGNGQFQPAVEILSGCCSGIAASDLNGDGKLDLAFGANDDRLGVFLGNGDGTFGSVVYSQSVASPYPPLLVDFNSDGKPDAALVSQGGGIAVALGNGDGTFGNFVTFPIGGGFVGSSVVAADLNTDGKIDLVATDPGPVPFKGTIVSVLMGNGDGTFGSPVGYHVGVDPVAAVVGDFNGDGRPDLAVSNYQGNSVSLLLGKGDGTFQRGKNLGVKPFPVTVGTADFDGDGILDLAVADGPLSVLRGTGSGRFVKAGNFSVPGSTQNLLIADFNQDAKPDVLAVNCCSSDILSLFLNVSP